MTSSRIDEDPTGLERLGGKGANLVRLRDAGFPVPRFVVISTDEYRCFVAEHGLEGEIERALGDRPVAASPPISSAGWASMPARARCGTSVTCPTWAASRSSTRANGSAHSSPLKDPQPAASVTISPPDGTSSPGSATSGSTVASSKQPVSPR